jgi:Protein of unknown function (DUF1588)/Protein of unknown function (DUF1592)/Protein of unknown function (DUF1595)/Protein of unknown function (DUF1585)
MKLSSPLLLSLAASLVLAACYTEGPDELGTSGGGPGGGSTSSSGGPGETITAIPFEVPRLSVAQIDRTLAEVLLDESAPAARALPADGLSPFDNDIKTQNPSQPFVSGQELLSTTAAATLFKDTARRNKVVGCVGSTPTDEACLQTFVTRTGKLLYRRTLATDEVRALVQFGMKEAIALSSFDAGAALVLRTMLMDTRFVYRFEDSSAARKNGYPGKAAMAGKLSFFLWGRGPSAELIDEAESGKLATKDQIAERAKAMLADPAARAQIERFHAQWFGYGKLPHPPALAASMQAEANAMVTSVLFEGKLEWKSLLLADKTKVDATVGDLYGLSGLGATPSVVTFPAGRKGLLSTSAFLSVASKFGDTSPTQRGKFIREQLMCEPIPEPPPGVSTDAPPPAKKDEKDCKINRYAAHRQANSTCIGCHAAMDPIGFGLERFDKFGKQRQYDYTLAGAPKMDCPIDGEGQLNGKTFNGPAALADTLLETGRAEACLAQRMAAFATGYPADAKAVAPIVAEYTRSGKTIQSLMVAFATSDAFIAKEAQP